MRSALEGIRILDLTSVGMGPMATQMLGDFGADVIKVESSSGDVFRHVTPQKNRGMSHAHLNFNRNKRSVVLDIKKEEAREQLFALLESSDVLVSNMRASAMRRLGLDYESLKEQFPRLVHCACYGYGENGAYAGRPAIDDTIQAASGMAWLQASAGDAAPRYANTVVADKVVALYVSNAIMFALYARERTGRGQAVEVPMFESMVAFLIHEHMAGMTYDPPMGDPGYSRLLNEFRRPFRTADGYMSVVPYTSAQWQRFFAMAGDPELANDPRFDTPENRSRHFSDLYQYVEKTLASKPTAEWETALVDADIPFSRVNSLADLLDDPHLKSVEFWRKEQHPSEGALIQPAIPIRLSDTPGNIRRHAPQLGEHTDEILAEIRQRQAQNITNGGTT